MNEDLTEIFSTDTLHPRHLIPAYFNIADFLAYKTDQPELEEKAEKLGEAYGFSWGLNDDDDYWYSEDAHELLNELWYLCNEYVPEGYYVGSSEGDGACIGIFQVLEEDYA